MITLNCLTPPQKNTTHVTTIKIIRHLCVSSIYLCLWLILRKPPSNRHRLTGQNSDNRWTEQSCRSSFFPNPFHLDVRHNDLPLLLFHCDLKKQKKLHIQTNPQTDNKEVLASALFTHDTWRTDSSSLQVFDLQHRLILC